MRVVILNSRSSWFYFGRFYFSRFYFKGPGRSAKSQKGYGHQAGTMNVFKKLKYLKTLLVDDDEWIRDAMSIFFTSEGCRIQTLETAEEALQVCKKEHYDIVIVDYMLPGMNGISFVKALDLLERKQEKGLKSVPKPVIKILITAPWGR